MSISKEKITIPTYAVGEAEKAPLFFDLRNHQGTKGSVYPLRMLDKLSSKKTNRTYDAIRLENDYIRVVLLPELGGRIYEGYDKTLDYHFVYHNNVIKPAMIGLAGAWVSGGIEFNWPQHHRPTTFMPVDAVIETDENGVETAWMGEIEPIYGLKGMVGVSIDPHHSYLRVRVRLYNCTEQIQTFHWWANLAVHTGDSYQLQFPPDIDYVTFHYKNVISPFPIVKNEFAAVDFGKDGTDIRWFKNIPAPASFFILNSRFNFMGGYDHAKGCGTVHVADRHISPGKKFFTWGTGEFGQAWQKNLTDEDSPYIEIMTGVYTDNQPDFSFLHPYETKTFEQLWYATSQLPCLKNANAEAAISLGLCDGGYEIGVLTTSVQKNARICLSYAKDVLIDETVTIVPGKPYHKVILNHHEISLDACSLQVFDELGETLITYQKPSPYFADQPSPMPHLPSKPAAPIESVEELYLEGLQIEQYKHPLMDPADYYQEGLRRDPMDSRLNIAMGLLHMRKADFSEAETCLRNAVERLTKRNENPYDGEALYQLGVVLRKQNNFGEALERFQKAAWDMRWRAAAMAQSAQICLCLQQWEQALSYAKAGLRLNADSIGLRMAACAAFRHLGQPEKAKVLAQETVTMDPLAYSARFELSLCERSAVGAQASNVLKRIIGYRTLPWLQLASEYIGSHLWLEALNVLDNAADTALSALYRAYVLDQMCLQDKAQAQYLKARSARQDDCFPWTDQEIDILRHAMEQDTKSATAPYLLGLIYYARHSRIKAMQCFEEAAMREPKHAETLRCLAIGAYDVRGNASEALENMRSAFELNRNERYLLELLQIMKVVKSPMQTRLALLDENIDLVKLRDDLYIEYIALLNGVGWHEKAAAALRSHVFHPYEGGEGLLVRQHILTYLLLGRAALKRGDAQEALVCFETAGSYPANYHEGRKYKASEAHIYYHIAQANQMMDNQAGYISALKNCEASGDFLDGAIVYKAMALRALSAKPDAVQLLYQMMQTAEEMITGKRNLYFGGYPTGLPFEQDIIKLNRREGHFIKALAYLGLGEFSEAQAAYQACDDAVDAKLWFDMVYEDIAKENAASLGG
jgi:tetratricopeptide (TPR) repeat protein